MIAKTVCPHCGRAIQPRRTPLLAEFQARGLVQRQVALAMRRSEPAVSKWVSGESQVPALCARKLHDLYGIPLELMRPDLWPPPPVQASEQAA